MSASRRTAVLAVFVLLLAGCSFRIGAPASPVAWEKSADQALGTALSSLGTAELLLAGQEEGRFTRSYAVVGLRDALEVLDKESAAFARGQPPASMAALDARTVALLHDALEAVDLAATATADRDAAGRDQALRQVRATRTAVQGFQDALPGAMP